MKFTLEPSLGQNGFQQVILFLVSKIPLFGGVTTRYTEIYSQNGKISMCLDMHKMSLFLKLWMK